MTPVQIIIHSVSSRIGESGGSKSDLRVGRVVDAVETLQEGEPVYVVEVNKPT